MKVAECNGNYSATLVTMCCSPVLVQQAPSVSEKPWLVAILVPSLVAPMWMGVPDGAAKAEANHVGVAHKSTAQENTRATHSPGEMDLVPWFVAILEPSLELQQSIVVTRWLGGEMEGFPFALYKNQEPVQLRI